MTLRLLVLVMLTWVGIQVGEARLALGVAAANQHVVKAYGFPNPRARDRSGSQVEWRSFLKLPKRAKKTKLPAKWLAYVPPESFTTEETTCKLATSSAWSYVFGPCLLDLRRRPLAWAVR